ncbi:MAG: protein-L-isoaspartate(D-aspartate) O-methyltransferase [Deltaproteobacteria bacterium]|nr:protein-L-isoaspartate(D-aspartate) O-methyltransferase [Deltaproteobacteria bacterium]MBW1870682.1 protein-L-isoaspartate(D-aspartate) O-methyltransferase [Deltaproteobacteria bacterium]
MGLPGRELKTLSRVLLAAIFVVLTAGCPTGSLCWAADPPDEAGQKERLQKLVELLRPEISDKRVLAAIASVPRHWFVPESQLAQAYENHPLPIGEDQTISQPFIVAYMTQALKLTGDEKILEVGTGSGYQAAVLSLTAGQVYSVEIIGQLSARSAKVLERFGAKNVRLKVGDGFDGWIEQAPFDGIIVTAAPEKVPGPLVAQLKEGGRLVIPLGAKWDQHLKTYIKRNGRLVEVDSLPVRFVPMTGKALR